VRDREAWTDACRLDLRRAPELLESLLEVARSAALGL
jgi:hypothetical protein